MSFFDSIYMSNSQSYPSNGGCTIWKSLLPQFHSEVNTLKLTNTLKLAIDIREFSENQKLKNFPSTWQNFLVKFNGLSYFNFKPAECFPVFILLSCYRICLCKPWITPVCLSQTNTQGRKITEENVLPFYNVEKWIDILVFSDKDE